jgi:hypothetical protein
MLHVFSTNLIKVVIRKSKTTNNKGRMEYKKTVDHQWWRTTMSKTTVRKEIGFAISGGQCVGNVFTSRQGGLRSGDPRGLFVCLHMGYSLAGVTRRVCLTLTIDFVSPEHCLLWLRHWPSMEGRDVDHQWWSTTVSKKSIFCYIMRWKCLHR